MKEDSTVGWRTEFDEPASPAVRRRRLAVLIAAHNRRETTMKCLEALYQSRLQSVALSVHLTDDGSVDGTSDAVRARFPQVKLLRGDGQLYWNGGMRLAWRTALRDRPDFYLWLNDDTALRPEALSGLLALHERIAPGGRRAIVVGRTVSSNDETTYGGYVRVKSISRLRFRHLSASETECDTFNGNCVLIPERAVEEIGLLSGHFRHGFGDNDYGLRARRAGYRVVEMKAPVATQDVDRHPAEETRKLNASNWRFVLFHPKGVPVREWFWFCRAHGGALWPINFVYRYVKMALA
jgi:GT2 family glycosyltransferase